MATVASVQTATKARGRGASARAPSQPARCAARSLALRERGFSGGLLVGRDAGFFQSGCPGALVVEARASRAGPPASGSSGRQRRRPARRRRGSAASSASSSSSSRFTAMRSAWKVRVAGIDASDAHGADGAHDGAAKVERRLELALGERALDAPRDAPRAALLAVAVDDVRELVVVEPVDELERGLARRRGPSACRSGPRGGSSSRARRRRAAASSPRGPRRARRRARRPARASSSGAPAKRRVHERHAIRRQGASRSLGAAIAAAVPVDADDARPAPPRGGPTVCPPRAQRRVDVDAAVARGERAATTSSLITAVCSKRFTSLTSSLSSRQTHSTAASASTPGKRELRVAAHRPSSARRAPMSRRSSSVVSKCALPGVLVPELGVACPLPAQRTSFFEARVVAQRRRDEDAPGVVDLALDGARDVDALELLHRAVELRELGEPLLERGPLRQRVGDEARVERAREHDAPLARRPRARRGTARGRSSGPSRRWCARTDRETSTRPRLWEAVCRPNFCPHDGKAYRRLALPPLLPTSQRSMDRRM